MKVCSKSKLRYEGTVLSPGSSMKVSPGSGMKVLSKYRLKYEGMF